jgi:hypothetical protein
LPAELLIAGQEELPWFICVNELDDDLLRDSLLLSDALPLIDDVPPPLELKPLNLRDMEEFSFIDELPSPPPLDCEKEERREFPLSPACDVAGASTSMTTAPQTARLTELRIMISSLCVRNCSKRGAISPAIPGTARCQVCYRLPKKWRIRQDNCQSIRVGRMGKSRDSEKPSSVAAPCEIFPAEVRAKTL